MEILQKPITLSVRQKNKGTVSVDCDLFAIKEMSEDKLQLLPALFSGYAGKVRIDVDVKNGRRNRELLSYLSTMISINTDFQIYTRPLYDGFANFYANTENQLWDTDYFPTCEGILETFNGRPVIFCGAGPSLATYRDKLALICESGSTDVIAGGSAIRVFCKWGIRPAYCLAADPWETEWTNVFEHLDPEWINGLTLIASAATHFECIRYWKECGGKVVWVPGNDALHMLNYLHSPAENVPIGLTVSTFAVGLAQKGKADHLVLCGVDMCFQESEHYADEGHVLDRMDGQRVEVKGISTRPAWRNEASLLEGMAQRGNLKIKRVVPRGMTVLPTGGIPSINPSELDRYVEGPNPPKARDTKVSINQIIENCEVWMEKLKLLYKDPAPTTAGYEGFLMPYERLQFAKMARGEYYNKFLLKDIVAAHMAALESIISLGSYGEFEDE